MHKFTHTHTIQRISLNFEKFVLVFRCCIVQWDPREKECLVPSWLMKNTEYLVDPLHGTLVACARSCVVYFSQCWRALHLFTIAVLNCGLHDIKCNVQANVIGKESIDTSTLDGENLQLRNLFNLCVTALSPTKCQLFYSPCIFYMILYVVRNLSAELNNTCTLCRLNGDPVVRCCVRVPGTTHNLPSYPHLLLDQLGPACVTFATSQM